MMSEKNGKRTVAFFDFDGTLAEKDSLWPFLVAVRGQAFCLLALLIGFLAYIFTLPGCDRRTIVKKVLLRVTLGGLPLAKLKPAIERMKQWPKWMEPAASALKKHHEAGHVVVIATGSLDLYVPAMLRNHLPYHDLICTTMEVEGDALTGRMKSGNCVRARKAELVADYIAANGPFADSWAYGNEPHDLPMMELVKNRVII